MSITKMIEGDLKDLSEYFESQDAQLKEIITECIGGKSYGIVYRMPAADTGGEICFDNPDILVRFACLPLTAQKVFLTAVRKVINEFGNNVFCLTTRFWDVKKEVLQIELDVSGSLSINFVSYE
ncbi:MAG: hypothetical protein Q8L47_00695 [bacterium]|nr:hypothetical protein [bacterium]